MDLFDSFGNFVGTVTEPDDGMGCLFSIFAIWIGLALLVYLAPFILSYFFFKAILYGEGDISMEQKVLAGAIMPIVVTIIVMFQYGIGALN